MLALDSRLFPEDDYITIGACQVGDEIYGSDGELIRLTHKSEVFYKPMYRISLRDGRIIIVPEDHINTVVINTNPNNTLRWEECDLTTLELLRQPLIHTKKGNLRHRGTSSKSLVFIKNIQPIEHPEKTLPIDPYTLGVVLSDCRIQKPSCSVELTTHVDDLANYRQHVPYAFGLGRLDTCNPNVWTQSIRGLGPALKAMDLGVLGKDKFIPEEYFLGTIEQRLALLQGLMDTDGTVSKTGRTSFCSYSSKLLQDVVRLARSLGATASLNKKPHHTEIWFNEPLFRLPRKLERQRFDRKADQVAIISITLIEEESSQCVAEDSKERQL